MAHHTKKDVHETKYRSIPVLVQTSLDVVIIQRSTRNLTSDLYSVISFITTGLKLK